MPMINAVRLANWAGGLWAALVSVQAKLSRASRMLFMGNHSSSVPGGMCPGVGLSLRRLSRLNKDWAKYLFLPSDRLEEDEVPMEFQKLLLTCRKAPYIYGAGCVNAHALQ